jgi:transcriptional regulator with XRE-family HTH domain
MKNITLKEIATTLGISITTVSKALKDYSDVSEKTKKAVKELAENLNYTPNSFAVNLRTKESKTIGLIIPEVTHHFFSNIIKSIIDAAEKNGYLVIILQSNESLELEKKQVDLLINKRVDGILISLSNESNNDSHIQDILNRKIPLVMFDKIAKLAKCSKVVIDDQKAGFDATQHLIDKGCKKIAHIVEAFFASSPPNVICADIDVDESFDLYAYLKQKKMVNGVPVLLMYKKGNVSFAPDDSVTGADPVQLDAFFKRCGLHLYALEQAYARAGAIVK